MNICHDTGQPCPRASCDCCHDDRLDDLARQFRSLRLEAKHWERLKPGQRYDLERRLRACVTKIETISGSTNAAGKVETNHPPAAVPDKETKNAQATI